MEGLLIGLTEAIKSGTQSYNEARKLKLEQDRNDQMMKLGLLKDGYEQTPEGGLIRTPEFQQKQKFEQDQKNLTQKREAMQHGLIPVTDESGNITDFKRDTSYQDPAKIKVGLEIEDLRRKLSTSESSKKQVTSLSEKTSNQKSIAAAIQQGLDQLNDPKKSEDEKILIGREMLKTLNSQQGPDAIGAEEAKRLGALLEYQMFNFFNPGPKFGRDVPLFTKQVENNLARMKGNISSNESEIERLGGNETTLPGRSNIASTPKESGLLNKQKSKGSSEASQPSEMEKNGKIWSLGADGLYYEKKK